MTYCIAVSLKDGLVLTSDSRTNAGIDNVSIYGKMHAFETAPDRKIVVLSAGNLATTQAVIDQVKRDRKDHVETNLDSVRYLSEAAEYIGKISVEKQRRYLDAGGQNSFNPTATFILAGQIRNDTHAAYLIYPEGNFITTSTQTPYLQIGENKYGKPVLDRFLRIDTPLQEAGRCCLISMDSTMRSNASVGAPVELLIYHTDSFILDEYYCFQEDNEYLIKLRRMWHEKLKEVFIGLPHFSTQEARPLPNS
ncbi:peptidase [Candidatus Symbiobacter mobilis]|nr:peptidase [Candidatus Symbiobacter mobilis]